MKYVCDLCMVKAIRKRLAVPLSQEWGPNNTPFKYDHKCEICGETKDCHGTNQLNNKRASE